MLTPSHSDWDEQWSWRPGGAKHAFIKTLTHEMMNSLHYDTREQYQYSRDRLVPRWVLEGLAEFEGYFNTTESNRQHAETWLVEYAYEELRDEIVYGRTLLDRRTTIMSTDRYHGSAILMWFFAEQFGPEVHVEFFKRSVRDVIYQYGSNPLLFHNQMRTWLTRKYGALDP